MSADLLKLIAWTSPAFPVGGFAWSSGLEAASRMAVVSDAEELLGWCRAALSEGWMHVDAALLAHVMATGDPYDEANELALALATSPERLRETCEMAEAFLDAVAHWRRSNAPATASPLAYPVAFGRVAKEAELSAGDTVSAFLHAAVSAQIQAALRLLPIGQRDGAKILARLHDDIERAAEKALATPLEALGSATPIMDSCAMRHVELTSRIFRS